MKTKVLFFYADWCSGCFRMKQKFYDEVKKRNVRFDIIDVEEPEGVELSCKLSVRNVPTLVFMRGDKVIGVEKGNESYKNIYKYE